MTTTTLHAVRPSRAAAAPVVAQHPWARNDFAHDLLRALATRPRSVSPKWFYDQEGSRLFDAICELPEYYPTRTETAILREYAADIARLAGPGCVLVEYGSGSSVKTRLLLDAMPELDGYVPIDISREHLDKIGRAHV